MPTITDFIFGPGTSVGTVQGVFVRFTNNVSGAQFITTAATNPQGQYTTPLLPPGDYTVATGPANTGPWTTYDPHYEVGLMAGDHLVTSGLAPAISAVNAGISGTPTLVGNDQAGLINFTTTAAAPGVGANLFTVTFAVAYAFAPIVVLAMNGGSGVQNAFTASSLVAASFAVSNVNALSNSLTYAIAYFVVQPRVV